MNEERYQEYLNFINSILQAQSEEELQQLFANNQNLVDEGLIQTMLYLADNDEDENRANYLRNVANNLYQYLQAQNNQPTKADYEFLMNLLRLVAETEDDKQQVYPFLEQNLNYLTPKLIPCLNLWWENTIPNETDSETKNYLVEVVFILGNGLLDFPFNKPDCLEIALKCFQNVLLECKREVVPLDWATTQNNLAIAYTSRIKGNRSDNLETAIQCYKNALLEWKREFVPLQWAAIQNNLASAYSDRIKGNRSDNLEMAIQYYKSVLLERKREVVPLDWATTQNNLAIAYTSRIKGNRSDNLETAIQCYQNALLEYKQEIVPLDWAMTQHNLGNAYLNRIKEDRAENLENAIQCYQNALLEWKREVVPLQWAMTQNNLASAYLNRIKGNRAENIENAIQYYQNALLEWKREVVPLQWATTQNSLASAYLNRIKGDRAENLENAIQCYQNALLERKQEVVPLDWAMTQNNLGNAYCEKIRGDKSQNLETAIQCYQNALLESKREIVPLQWAAIQHNLGNAYLDRIKGDRAENLENAIQYYENALFERKQEIVPLDWAITQNNLGNAYCQKIRGDKSQNLETAIQCYQNALLESKREIVPLQWAITQHNLGLAYSKRIKGNRSDNLEVAIQYCESALLDRKQEVVPLDWAMTQHNLGLAYSKRIKGNRAENIENAIQYYQNALFELTQKVVPLDWATTQNNLASAYCDRIRGERGENLERAIKCYENALEIYTPENVPLTCLTISRNLGNLYYGEGDWHKAIESYTIAIEIIEDNRLQSLDEKRRQEIIAENIDVYENMIQSLVQVGDIDKALEYVESSRSRRLADILHSKDTYSDTEIPERVQLWEARQLLNRRLNDLISNRTQEDNLPPINAENGNNNPKNQQLALNTRLQENKARKSAITTEIEQIEQQLSELDSRIRAVDFRLAEEIQPPRLDVDKLQALVPDDESAIISFFTTKEDTHIFIVRKTGNIQLLTCEGQGLGELQNYLRENWLIPYLQFQRESKIDWFINMTTVMENLAQRLQINKLVNEYLGDDIKQLILVPHLDLHIIPLSILPITPPSPPLQSGSNTEQVSFPKRDLGGSQNVNNMEDLEDLQREENNPPSPPLQSVGSTEQVSLPKQDLEGSTLGDKYIIRTLPSCLILKFCSEYAPVDISKTAIVENATDDLVFTPYECYKINEHYQPSRQINQLIGSQEVTIKNYLHLLEQEQINHLHTSHHAYSRIDKPEYSALILGDGQIKLADLLFMRLPNLSLVFLSCCETALGSNLQARNDEILTIAGGFLTAGARIVISTLWAVDELPTALFSIFFYQELEREIPPIAVKKAQDKLKNLTGEEMRTYIPEMMAVLKPKLEASIKEIEENLAKLNTELANLKSILEPQEDEIEKKRKEKKKELKYSEISSEKEKIRAEIAELEQQLKTMDTQLRELETIITKNKKKLSQTKISLDKIEKTLDDLATLDYPFQHPIDWAGFVCQGLENFNFNW